MKAPFPYFGGKSWIASEVWQRFGDVGNYVEPFFGSGAVLLGRPHEPQTETVNDADGYVSNFWRAVQHDPEHVAFHADWPVNENDLHARHVWLLNRRDDLQARLEGDPDFYDAKIAGWWCWGMSCWIGSGFCSGQGPWQVVDGKLVHLGNKGQGVNRQRVHLGDKGRGVNRKRVHLGNKGQGVNRQLVHLGNKGRGVNRQLVHLGNKGVGVNRQRGDVVAMFEALSDRLRNVRVCSGDWTRVMGPSVTVKHGITAVFLDPPYDQNERAELYRVEMDESADVRRWCLENGANPLLRIALCGYEGEHEMPDSWECYEWKARGGFGSQGGEDSRGKENRKRERVWFSPACLKPQAAPTLFDWQGLPV